MGIGIGHDLEYPLVDKSAEAQQIQFDIVRQGIVLFAQLRLEDRPDSLVVGEGFVQEFAAVFGIPFFLTG